MTARSIRHALEFALARLALATVPHWPRPAVVWVAHAAGTLAWLVSPHLRRVARANLDIAFGTARSPAEKSRITQRSFQSFALVLLDMFWFSRDSVRRTAGWIDFDPALVAQLFRPAAQVCVTAHMGNWEVLGMAFSAQGYPLVSVAAPLANRRLDALFIDLRRRTGQQILSKHGAVRGLLKTLKGGGKIALVLDQNTKPSDGGIFVDFFGLPAPVSSAVATLALRTGAAVYTGVCLPDRRGRYFVPAPELIAVADRPGTAGDAERALTSAIVRSLEHLLRDHPEHWLWMYKRWKYIAPGRDAAEYPFYAKGMAKRDRQAMEA